MKQKIAVSFLLLFFLSYTLSDIPPSTIVPGYTLTSLTQQKWGYNGTLELINGSEGPFGDDIQTLSLFVYYQTDSIVRIKIIDPNNERWEVPSEPIIAQLSPPSITPQNLQYTVEITENPFNLAIIRTDSGSVIFNTTSPSEDENATQFSGLIVSIYLLIFFIYY